MGLLEGFIIGRGYWKLNSISYGWCAEYDFDCSEELLLGGFSRLLPLNIDVQLLH